MLRKDDVQDLWSRLQSWRKLAQQIDDEKAIEALAAEIVKLEQQIEQATKQTRPPDASSDCSK